ncbi:unnamed protein product [Arctogadus glacialis]
MWINQLVRVYANDTQKIEWTPRAAHTVSTLRLDTDHKSRASISPLRVAVRRTDWRRAAAAHSHLMLRAPPQDLGSTTGRHRKRTARPRPRTTTLKEISMNRTDLGQGSGGGRLLGPVGAARPAWAITLLASVLIFTTVVDVLGNSLVIISVFRNRKLRNAGR